MTQLGLQLVEMGMAIVNFGVLQINYMARNNVMLM
jgi:hypothetical protein